MNRKSLPLTSPAADLRFPLPSFFFFSSGGGDGAPTPTPLTPKTSFPCGGPVSFFRLFLGCELDAVEVAEGVLLIAGARDARGSCSVACAGAGGATDSVLGTGGTSEDGGEDDTAAHVGAVAVSGGGTGAGLPHIADSDACPCACALLLPAPFAVPASGCSVDIRLVVQSSMCVVSCLCCLGAADRSEAGSEITGRSADEGRGESGGCIQSQDASTGLSSYDASTGHVSPPCGVWTSR